MKLMERGGSIELTIASPRDENARTDRSEPAEPAGGTDVIWRVKIVEIRSTAMIVEQPAGFGSSFKLRPGVDLIGAMTIGQNRWMFLTRSIAGTGTGGAGANTLALELPRQVERCTRRSFFRTSTAALRLPQVRCWPLLSLTSVGPAEAANRALISDLVRSGSGPIVDDQADNSADSILLPEVGPAFRADLLNVSGGGLGVLVERQDQQAAQSRPFWWLRLDLRPQIPAPVAVTARLAHTHIDSSQNLYCGLAFEFPQSGEHRQFMIDLFSRYTDELQRRQIAASARTA
ncbi:MAG: hypothetical protein KF768_02535 [Phycisphaeraceae bacterium]|nr:hypothetical protein [Phycisphaeraceae bacterium]